MPQAAAVHRRLLDRGVLAGIPLSALEPDDASLVDGLLVCATEVTRPDEIERFAAAVRAEVGSERAAATATAGAVR